MLPGSHPWSHRCKRPLHLDRKSASRYPRLGIRLWKLAWVAGESCRSSGRWTSSHSRFGHWRKAMIFDWERVVIYVAHPGSSSRSTSVLPRGFFRNFVHRIRTMPETRERHNHCRRNRVRPRRASSGPLVAAAGEPRFDRFDFLAWDPGRDLQFRRGHSFRAKTATSRASESKVSGDREEFF